jgi:hypothetical protein
VPTVNLTLLAEMMRAPSFEENVELWDPLPTALGRGRFQLHLDVQHRAPRARLQHSWGHLCTMHHTGTHISQKSGLLAMDKTIVAKRGCRNSSNITFPF